MSYTHADYAAGLPVPTRREIDAQPDSDLRDGEYRCVVCGTIVDSDYNETISVLHNEMEVCSNECGSAAFSRVKREVQIMTIERNTYRRGVGRVS